MRKTKYVCAKCKHSPCLETCTGKGGVLTADMVDHPPHYQGEGGIEVIDVIDAFNLGFSAGNAVKYILRAGHKGDRIEDLRKAIWYLSHEIDNAKGSVKP